MQVHIKGSCWLKSIFLVSKKLNLGFAITEHQTKILVCTHIHVLLKINYGFKHNFVKKNLHKSTAMMFLSRNTIFKGLMLRQ